MKKNKILGYLILIFFGFFGLIGYANAAPIVTGISGTVADGSSITIEGNGFGTSSPDIVLFDNFEGGVVGNVISLTTNSATIHEWSASNGSGLTTYSNEWSHSGTKSMKNN